MNMNIIGFYYNGRRVSRKYEMDKKFKKEREREEEKTLFIS